MGKTIGQFEYKMMGDQTTHIVQIRLKAWDESNDWKPLVSPDLMTEAEIDGHVQALKDDLDAVGRAAIKALRKRRPTLAKNT